MSKLLIIIGFLSLTSCVSLKKQFIKKPVESAELCRLFYPTKELESKEITRYKTDTITIKGDSIECQIKTIVKDTIINGEKKPKIIYVPAKVKCPDSKIIKDTIETEKEVIIKDTSCDVLLVDREKKIEVLKTKFQSKEKQLFYLYFILGIIIAYKLVKIYIKSKTK